MEESVTDEVSTARRYVKKIKKNTKNKKTTKQTNNKTKTSIEYLPVTIHLLEFKSEEDILQIFEFCRKLEI